MCAEYVCMYVITCNVFIVQLVQHTYFGLRILKRRK